MTSTAEYLAQGRTAFLAGVDGHALETGWEAAFDARFHDPVDYERTHHPKWLQLEGAAQGEALAHQVGQIAAILAGTAPVTGADINIAANAVRDAQETPSRFC